MNTNISSLHAAIEGKTETEALAILARLGVPSSSFAQKGLDVRSPITGEPIQSWYKPGETWYGLFGSDANAIEECRAEGVGLLLLCDKRVHEIFGYTANSEVKGDEGCCLLNFFHLAGLTVQNSHACWLP